jgi:hypothetical protein
MSERSERHFEQLLRETVRDLATEGRPVDLGVPALRAAHRVRVRRAVSAVAGVVIVIGGLAFAVNRGAGTDRSVPPAGPSVSASAGTATQAPSPTGTESTDPGTAPVLLPGGWLIRGAPGPDDGDLIIYDEQRGRYRLMVNAGPTVSSPNGRYLATVHQSQIKITELPDGREIARHTQVEEDVRPVWSPDSSMVAYVTYGTDGTRVRTGRVDGTETFSDVVACSAGCTLKWFEGGARIRVYAGDTYQVEVKVGGGAVGPAPAKPDDPCGRHVLAYRIDDESWLCVTPTGFAVTTKSGAVTQRVPFPKQIDGIPVKAGDTRWDLFRPK